jgi:hypothetical protein
MNILNGLFNGIGGEGDSMLFFLLLLVVIFCNCNMFEDSSSLLFFFLLLVVLFCGGCGGDEC